MNKELLQQTLDALLEYEYAKTDKADRLGSAAIAALRVAIAQPEQPDTSAKPDQTYTGDDLAMAYKDGYAAGGVSMAQEGDAKDAWAAGFKAGNDWQIKVGSYYGQGNFGNQPEQPANPYAAMASQKGAV